MEERYCVSVNLQKKKKNGNSVWTPSQLFELFLSLWTAETCAPRMRKDWTEENPTLGQCSVTAFVLQDLFGGEVYGIPLGDGNYHCYNVFAEGWMDLTSEQFPEKLDYGRGVLQSRENHFQKEEKFLRYQCLKEKAEKMLENR